jgi:hypothetical protein
VNPDLNVALEMKRNHDLEFRFGFIESTDQLAELWDIDKRAYGEASISFETFQAWWRAYPSGLPVLHWKGRIGGAIGMWPLSERSASRLTNGQIREGLLKGRMIRPFRERAAAYWYFSGVVLRPELIGTRAIRVLLGGGLWHWIDVAAIAFPCRLLALSSSPEGQLLLTRFGFRCCRKAHIMPDGLALFALDLVIRQDFTSLLERRRLQAASGRVGN